MIHTILGCWSDFSPTRCPRRKSKVPGDATTVQHIAVDWVTMTWRASGDTRWAVSTLARLGETDPEFDLGLFIGLDDEWSGGWGRLESDLQSAARHELHRLLHGGDSSKKGPTY
jgi:hypothetical protein